MGKLKHRTGDESYREQTAQAALLHTLTYNSTKK